MSYVIGLIVFAIVLLLAVVLDVTDGALHPGKVLYFIDLPSLLIVATAPLLACTAHAPRGVWRAVLEPGALDGETATEVLAFLRTLVRLSLFSGTVGAVVGLTLMLQALAVPARIGPGMATAVLSLLYAMVLALLAHAAYGRVRMRGPAGAPDAAGVDEPLLWSLYAYPLLVALPLVLLLLSFARVQ